MSQTRSNPARHATTRRPAARESRPRASARSSAVDIPAALRHLRRTDGPMAELIKRHGSPELQRTRNSFESLGRAIIYQQLSGKAAGTIYRRFLGLFPRGRFPTPARLLATSPERLRSVGLSRGKTAYLLDLASKFSDGTISSRRFASMDNTTLSSYLCQVKGIGQWSVDMFMIFGLLRPDVLPVGDLGVRKGMRMYFELADLPAPERMEALARPWRPYRSIATWYMWRIVDTQTP
ncbi:MAG: DNA-3-methyladenine glycosylase 2 family protein [Myxococcota bacterium]